MEKTDFYHAIKIDEEKCIGCAHCMKICPTEAIRIVGGKAKLHPNHCVDCGECFKVCPVDAYSVQSDNIETIYNYKYRIALFPSVFFGQFPDSVTIRQVHTVLKDMGFTHVHEISAGVKLLSEATNDLIKSETQEKPIISSFCPAIVRLIQVRFPSLVDNIVTLRSPADLAALYFKQDLIDKGVDENDICIFYVTPCAAKIAAVKSPVGESKALIDGVINLDYIFNKVYRILKQNEIEGSNDKACCYLGDDGVRWSLTNGEARHVEGRALSIDGIRNVMEFLEKVEDEEVQGIDFLELRACDESCAGGILNVENRFLCVERLNSRARANKAAIEEKGKNTRFNFDDREPFLKQQLHLNKRIEPRTITLDENMLAAMKKMQRSRDLMCFLPGIDCGACGSPTCQALAQDIVSRRANLSYCIFMQRQMEKNKKLSPDHAFKIIEKVWGKDRLAKDCSKKGAKHESN